MSEKVKTKKSKSSQVEQSDGEGELSPSQILERVKPDRVAVTKPEEDRRRRTIIVEKCNDSYGFTLQSYGIHYKKEQEIEMITYVDYVEYDGPAYRAGMREGDVILSINGHDMEKADHKTLVNFIKNCDSRMRMVVLFEDCVKKVELHMRYIQLQRLLQVKMAELDRLCVREKEVLQGKWKTHSLPARKKSSKTDAASSVQMENGGLGYGRPTLSTEDVARAAPTPGFGGQPIMLAYRTYQYIDQRGRAYVLQPAHSSSGDYFVGWPSYQARPEGICLARGTSRRCSASGVYHEGRVYHQSNGGSQTQQPSKHHSKAKGHCNPCVQSTTSPQDNTSLEAYDLASPCCNSQCVPSRRRKHQHKPKKSASNVESSRGEWKEKSSSSSRSNQSSGYLSSSSSTRHHHHHHHHHQPGRNLGRYFSLASQCSLHSCTSSELNSTQERTATAPGGDSSGASYTTSLSSDTLYWEQTQADGVTRQHSVKSNSSSHGQQELASKVEDGRKPKSWDNLTTKAFGGYGFGYGYTEQKASTKGSRKPPKYSVQPTKSQESLLLLASYPSNLSDSSISCDCLDSSSAPINHSSVGSSNPRFFTIAVPPSACSGSESFYQRDKASQTERRIVNVDQAPEVTRL